MAKVYVGTYAKYNNGSIAGKWINLEKFKSYDEFVEECRKVHKNERDPEFMIQDYDDFPDGFSCGDWLSEKDFNDVIQALKEEQTELQDDSKYQIVDYSDKAIAVAGDTKEIKDQLKALGGRYNPKLSCGAGWIFSKKVEDKVRELLQNDGKVCTCPLQKVSDKALLDEYLNEWRKVWEKEDMIEYHRKKVSSIHRLSNGGLIYFEKPSIETSFCFGYSDSAYNTDEYDNANRMAHHAATSEEYFLEQNLKGFDAVIKSLENTEEYTHICISRESYSSQKEPLNLWSYKVLKYWQYNDAVDRNYYTDLQEINAEDRAIILNALKTERAKFEKRLRAYLKRYGLSKVKSWSYWRDA